MRTLTPLQRVLLALITGAAIGVSVQGIYDYHHPRCVVANSYTSGVTSTVPLIAPRASSRESIQWAPYAKDGANYHVQTPINISPTYNGPAGTPPQDLTIGPTQTKTGIDTRDYTASLSPWNQSPNSTSTDLLVNRANTDVAWEKLSWRSFAVENNSVELASLSVKVGRVVYRLAGQVTSRAAFYRWLDRYVLSGMKAAPR